jgi:cell division protein ZapA
MSHINVSINGRQYRMACEEGQEARLQKLAESLETRIGSLEKELDALRDVRVAAADHARATQSAVANALNSAADRIEKTTQVLNRTIGGGVAIG